MKLIVFIALALLGAAHAQNSESGSGLKAQPGCGGQLCPTPPPDLASCLPTTARSGRAPATSLTPSHLLPPNTVVCPKYTVAAGDSLFSISQKFDVLPGESQRVLPALRPPQPHHTLPLPFLVPLSPPILSINCRRAQRRSDRVRPDRHPPPDRPGDLPARLRQGRLRQRQVFRRQGLLQGLHRAAG
jgi:hypothetical protein